MQENAARWHFESVTRPPRSFTKFRISAGGHLVFGQRGSPMILGQNLKFATCLFMVTVDQEVSEWWESHQNHLPRFQIGFLQEGNRLLASFHHRTEKLSSNSLNSNGPGMEQVVHTHRTSCRSGFERLAERVSVFCAYSSISVSSSPLFYLFTSATVPIAVHTTPKCDTEPIRYVTLFTKIQDHADQKSG